ncbi:MAG: Agmatine deiminase [Chloroflexi bacterium OLB15]|nr:MAG: Agmatine deiminase [Chloroflexi bacterium OLB15]
MPLPVRFDYIPYPLWRRQGLTALKPLLPGRAASQADGLHGGTAPETPAQMAHYLLTNQILPPGMNVYAARDAISSLNIPVHQPDLARQPAAAAKTPIRLPAQWEAMEAVITAFPVLYPPLWESHAQIIEAVSEVARADVLIPDAAWANAVWLYLETRAFGKMENVRLIVLPTDDIWVRDFGSFTGRTSEGHRVMLGAAYDPLPAYPQANDAAFAARYAAGDGIPFRAIDLHTEGGNFWSDGAGTLIASQGIYTRNPHLSRAEIERRLHLAFSFEKLIVTPSLWREETGHVDLIVKLADARTVLITHPSLRFNKDALRQTHSLFKRETNACGDLYRIYTLPALPPYLNWGIYPIWRTYTNSLTVNGRVLVPAFMIGADEHAMAIYKMAMPDHEVIPIRCDIAVNGGGAVHCLTKEVPA